MGVSLEAVSKSFGSVAAVDGVTLEIPTGFFYTVLGPSGCGKTSLLRIVAGLEFPDGGRVFFDGQDVTSLPPYSRGVGMVFQNYALWPHMKVRNNVAYGLKVKGKPREDTEKRVKDVLALVGLGGLEDRYPSQLSGGQQQRVALARALAIEPKLLLLDEPLSNLDAKLRVEVRAELRALQRRLGITTLYVTHDQEEAFSISDTVAIMNSGRVAQVGSPREIYTRPADRFVASFIGESAFFEGNARPADGRLIVSTKGGLHLKVAIPAKNIREGASIVVAVRPEAFHLHRMTPEDNVIEGSVLHTAYLGAAQRIYLDVNGIRIVANVPSSEEIIPGSTQTIFFKPEDALVLAD